MNVVGVAPDFYWLTFEVPAYSTEITVKFIFIRRMDKWFTVFGAEHQMYIVFYE